MVSNEFFSKDDIEKHLNCVFCENRFDIARNLPCGEIICTNCETVYFKSNEQDAICKSCSQHHEMPSNGFPVNKFIQRLLKINPRFYRGELHESAVEAINQIGLINRQFESETSYLESLVIEHCDLLRNNVDLKAESAIDAIQKHRERLLCEINEYQKKCLGKCASNLERFKMFMMESNGDYNKWVELLNRVDIKEHEIGDVFKRSTELLKKVNFYQKVIDYDIYGAKKLNLCENESEISSNIIGTLTKTSDSSLSFNLIERKPKLKINYKTETQPTKYLDAILMNIDNERICIAVSMCIHGSCCLKLKLFSNNGEFIKEISEDLHSKYNKFGAATINDKILIQITSRVNSDELKTYSNNLEEISSMRINFFNSRIFTHANRIYFYSIPKHYWYIYDENLNPLESIGTVQSANYPFILNDASQIELKYGRIFIYYNLELKVVDNESREIIRTVKLDEKHANKDLIVKPTSSDTFMVVDRQSKRVCVFNFDLDCLLTDFEIDGINEISAISLTSNHSIVIYDNTTDMIYLF